MSCVLYYSNYCSHSKNILLKLSNSDIKSDIHFLCIDKRVNKEGKIYLILENGDNVLLHPEVTKVPALMLLNRNNKILFGLEIHNHFDLKIRTKQQKRVVNSRTDLMEPESFSLNSLTGSVISDNYSFVDMSSDELSAKGNGGTRMMYNYCGLNDDMSIHTPEEDYKPNKVDEGEIKQYEERRAAAIN